MRSDLVSRTRNHLSRPGYVIGRYCTTGDLHDSQQRNRRRSTSCHGALLSFDLFALSVTRIHCGYFKLRKRLHFFFFFFFFVNLRLLYSMTLIFSSGKSDVTYRWEM